MSSSNFSQNGQNKWEQIPLACIGNSIEQVCSNCKKWEELCVDSDSNGSSLSKLFPERGRALAQRLCRGRNCGELIELCKGSQCTPQLLLFILLRETFSRKKCFKLMNFFRGFTTSPEVKRIIEESYSENDAARLLRTMVMVKQMLSNQQHIFHPETRKILYDPHKTSNRLWEIEQLLKEGEGSLVREDVRSPGIYDPFDPETDLLKLSLPEGPIQFSPKMSLTYYKPRQETKISETTKDLETVSIELSLRGYGSIRGNALVPSPPHRDRGILSGSHPSDDPLELNSSERSHKSLRRRSAELAKVELRRSKQSGKYLSQPVEVTTDKLKKSKQSGKSLTQSVEVTTDKLKKSEESGKSLSQSVKVTTEKLKKSKQSGKSISQSVEVTTDKLKKSEKSSKSLLSQSDELSKFKLKTSEQSRRILLNQSVEVPSSPEVYTESVIHSLLPAVISQTSEIIEGSEVKRKSLPNEPARISKHYMLSPKRVRRKSLLASQQNEIKSRKTIEAPSIPKSAALSSEKPKQSHKTATRVSQTKSTQLELKKPEPQKSPQIKRLKVPKGPPRGPEFNDWLTKYVADSLYTNPNVHAEKKYKPFSKKWLKDFYRSVNNTKSPIGGRASRKKRADTTLVKQISQLYNDVGGSLKGDELGDGAHPLQKFMHSISSYSGQTSSGQGASRRKSIEENLPHKNPGLRENTSRVSSLSPIRTVQYGTIGEAQGSRDNTNRPGERRRSTGKRRGSAPISSVQHGYGADERRRRRNSSPRSTLRTAYEPDVSVENPGRRRNSNAKPTLPYGQRISQSQLISYRRRSISQQRRYKNRSTQKELLSSKRNVNFENQSSSLYASDSAHNPHRIGFQKRTETNYTDPYIFRYNHQPQLFAGININRRPNPVRFHEPLRIENLRTEHRRDPNALRASGTGERRHHHTSFDIIERMKAETLASSSRFDTYRQLGLQQSTMSMQRSQSNWKLQSQDSLFQSPSISLSRQKREKEAKYGLTKAQPTNADRVYLDQQYRLYPQRTRDSRAPYGYNQRSTLPRA